ncbi:MAG: hypothetical protein J5644_10160 [Bacteroidales bacterium]|nr:hypothetical protein [Bacteroidales bacterium]
MKENIRHTLRKAGLKLLLLVAVLAALDVIYYHTFYPKDLKEHCSLMNLSQKPALEGGDLIYLGESSNHSCCESDSDQRYICMMLDDLLPDHKVCNLAKDACHAGVFYDIMRNIPRESNVKTAVVTVNMRSFSSEWINSDLETALQKEQVMMKRAPALYKRMLLAFKGYTHWTEGEREKTVLKGLKKQHFNIPNFPYHSASEWDRALGQSGMLFNGNYPSKDTIALACHYIKDFAYQLDERNPRIKDLDRIVELCQKRGWKVIFSILADNMDQIEALVGPELPWLMKQNNQYIIDRYQPRGVTVVNNYHAVRDEDFFERVFPTEHYTQTGRLTIARNIAEELEF